MGPTLGPDLLCGFIARELWAGHPHSGFSFPMYAIHMVRGSLHKMNQDNRKGQDKRMRNTHVQGASLGKVPPSVYYRGFQWSPLWPIGPMPMWNQRGPQTQSQPPIIMATAVMHLRCPEQCPVLQELGGDITKRLGFPISAPTAQGGKTKQQRPLLATDRKKGVLPYSEILPALFLSTYREPPGITPTARVHQALLLWPSLSAHITAPVN